MSGPSESQDTRNSGHSPVVHQLAAHGSDNRPETRCLRCGYSTLGLSARIFVCPECGANSAVQERYRRRRTMVMRCLWVVLIAGVIGPFPLMLVSLGLGQDKFGAPSTTVGGILSLIAAFGPGPIVFLATCGLLRRRNANWLVCVLLSAIIAALIVALQWTLAVLVLLNLV
jgi:predicted RNA-binding Zn-ribbon protein involved in translation (DUF1610 family)